MFRMNDIKYYNIIRKMEHVKIKFVFFLNKM